MHRPVVLAERISWHVSGAVALRAAIPPLKAIAVSCRLGDQPNGGCPLGTSDVDCMAVKIADHLTRSG